MSTIIFRATRVFMLVAAFIILITILSTQNVFAESATRANSATSMSGNPSFRSLITGDSYTSKLGSFSKVTLYLSTTNDPSEISIGSDGYIDMSKTSITRKDKQPMFVQFGKPIIIKAGDPLSKTAYVNLVTSKLETLVGFDKGDKKAPEYTSSTKIAPSGMVDDLAGFPEWLTSSDTSNQKNVVSWFSNTANDFANLRNLIARVADPTGTKNPTTARKSALEAALTKATFNYKKDDGSSLTLTAVNILPGEDYAYWLIVYEPVVSYIQDPNQIFFPGKGGNAFLFTASDAVLANAKAGTSGYPVIAKFAAGTPKLTLEYNHDPDCNYMWYGYPGWTPPIPLAKWCPLPCPSVGQHYDGVKTVTRSPFAIPTPIVQMATYFYANENWLAYNGGYLFDKPTSAINSLIDSSAAVDSILLYGGYSVFINGPKNNQQPTVSVRTVMLNDTDDKFYDIPNVSVTLEVKNVSATVKTSEFGYVDVNGITDNKNVIPKKVVKPATAISIKSYQLYMRTVEEYDQRLTDSDLEDFRKEIEADTGKSINPEDIYLTADKTMALYENVDVIRQSTDELEWNKLAIFASEKANIDTLDEMVKTPGAVYESSKTGWKAYKGFTWSGKPIYITVLVPGVVVPTPPVKSSDPGTMAENELIKAFSGKTISTVSLEKTVNDITCDGTKTESYTYTDPVTGEKSTRYRTVPCGHPKDLAHAKNITPMSLTVQPAWYWANAMFDNLSKLSILRKSGTPSNDGVTFVFNQTGSFTSNNMSNAFDALTGYKFLAHRNADPKNDGKVKPLELAAYMSKQNQDFQNFITPYYGGVYPSAYSGQTGSFAGQNIDLYTSMPLPQSISSVGSGNFCSGGSSSSLSIPSKLTSSDITFKTQTNIKIDPTVASEDKKAPDFATTKQYWGIGSTDKDVYPSYHIQVQSDPIMFFPAFKMDYQKNVDGGPYSQAWILAAGEKTFVSNDYVKISITDSPINVTAPWSRDAEDKWIDPKGARLTARTIPTAKSASMIKADASGSVIRIDAFINMQDPAFVDASQRASVQAKNDNKVKEYNSMVQAVIDKLKSNGVSFYSNMFESTTPETLHKVVTPDNFQDLSKTTLRLAGPVTVYTQTGIVCAYIDPNGMPDYTTSTRIITLNGKTYPLTSRWIDIGAVKSTQVMDDLLVKNGGKTGFYNEDYEGIVVCHITYVLTVEGLSSTYAQIHPQHSDALTERNELAKPLKFIGGSEYLLNGEHFGIGVEYRLPTLKIGGQDFGGIVLPSAPYLFDIRDSVYSTK